MHKVSREPRKWQKKGIKTYSNVVGEGNITSSDIANIEKLYNEVVRTKWDVSALNMNTRIKNLQGNSTTEINMVYGSDANECTAKSIVAKVNELIKEKLPPEYGMAKRHRVRYYNRDKLYSKLSTGETMHSPSSLMMLSQHEWRSSHKTHQWLHGRQQQWPLPKKTCKLYYYRWWCKQLANIIKEFTWVDAE